MSIATLAEWTQRLTAHCAAPVFMRVHLGTAPPVVVAVVVRVHLHLVGFEPLLLHKEYGPVWRGSATVASSCCQHPSPIRVAS